MNTNILKNNTVRQILGASAGMAIAGLVYVGMNNVSDLNIKGLLVSTNTVSENSGEVSINDKNVDEATLRRIAGNARVVADQLDAAPTEAQPVSNDPDADARRAQRLFARQTQANFAAAPTYSADPNHVMTEEERNAIRAGRLRPQFTEATQIAAVAPLTFNNPAEEPVTTITNVPQGDDGLHSGAGPAPTSSALPSSGLGLNLLLLATFAVAFVTANTRWRTQAASLIRSIRLV